MNRGWAWAFVLIALGALGVRCIQLDLRPMHNDEAVNAIRQAAAWSSEPYRYDPGEHHGPTLYYFSLIPIRARGVGTFAELDEATLRLTPALAGVGMVLLLWALRHGLGMGATVVAAGLTALSPALVFYSRNFIHEMLLGLFTLLFGIALWRYLREPRLVWAMVAGMALGLMHATKETFVLPLAAMMVAVGLVARWELGPEFLVRARQLWNARHVVMAFLIAGAVSVMFYTSFFTNWRGPLDSILAYLPWLQRAAGNSPHIHPWYFYLERLLWFQRARGPVWTEGWILALACVGGVLAVRGRGLGETDPALARGLLVFSLTLTLFYSLIPYKTPWCLVGFWHGFVLLAGVGAVQAWRWLRPLWGRMVYGGILLAGVLHLGWQCWQASFVRHSDWRNPYVYAQTVPDVLRMVERVLDLARVHPDRLRMPVQVAVPNHGYWPLPWYWRSLERVGWYDRFPDAPWAPVVVAAAEWNVRWDERSDRRWLMTGLYELRPRVFLELYVELELWKRWLAERPRPAEEDGG